MDLPEYQRGPRCLHPPPFRIVAPVVLWRLAPPSASRRGNNTGMSNVAMDADPEIQERIAALTADRDSRATALAYDALDILEAAASSFPKDGLGAYLDGVCLCCPVPPWPQ